MLKIILIIFTFINTVSIDATTTGSELIGGNFHLMNLEGEIVRGANFKGKYSLIFFGYTHCPKTCPIGLNSMMAVYNKLKDHKINFVPIFITIDPEVDTPSKLRKFKTRFSNELIVLRGSKDQTNYALKQFRGYYDKKSKIKIDHSALIYFMDKEGNYITHFSAQQKYSNILDKIVEKVKKDQ